MTICASEAKIEREGVLSWLLSGEWAGAPYIEQTKANIHLQTHKFQSTGIPCGGTFL